MNKDGLRKVMIGKRNFLTKQEIFDKSKLVQQNLFSLPEFQQAKNVLSYVSFGTEVRTQDIIEHCLIEGKKVVVLFTDIQKHKLLLFKFESFELLAPSDFGIPEPDPKTAKPAKAKDMDLIIAPGLAFDEHKHRVGYGKGYFDSFLSDLKNKSPVVALAYDFQVVDSVPVEENDVKVDKIVTDKRIIE